MTTARGLPSLLLILVTVSPCLADNKPGNALQLIPQQKEEIPEFPIAVAVQKCEDWAWAAGLETLLRLQGVKLDQRYWVTKLLGGELCRDDFGKLADLARVIDGEYVLQDGRKVRLETRYHEGAPTSVDDLIFAVRAAHPLLIFWKRHAYLLAGILFDEYIGANGHRMYEARELKLRDPYVAEGEKRFVTFTKGTDDPADINGTLQVTVTPIEQQPWQR